MSASTTRRPLPALAVLLVLAVLTSIVWWRVLHRPDDSASAAKPTVVAPASCTPGSRALAIPKPGTVTVDVLNGSGRDLLATQITAQLKARGFKTGTPGDSTSVTGIAEIRFGAKGKLSATLLSYYLPGAKLVTATRADAGVDLVLGSGFHALATSAVVAKSVAKATKPC